MSLFDNPYETIKLNRKQTKKFYNFMMESREPDEKNNWRKLHGMPMIRWSQLGRCKPCT